MCAVPVQSQLTVLGPVWLQLPPFWHGFGEQVMVSIWQLLPVNSVPVQSQLKEFTCGVHEPPFWHGLVGRQ